MKKSFLRGWIIFLLTLPLFGLSQSRQVSGTVTDEKGSALSNVSIVQKGTTNGTVTDEKGFFSLSVSGRNPVLVFSYTGMAEHELVVGNGSTFNVSLAASGPMSEVVVTALGINRKERSLGYATQQIRGDNLTLTKEQNVIGSLAGKIAGVQVTGSSGASMGGTQKVRIRGVNSLTGTDQPLVVVDGTPLSNSNYADRNGPDYGNVTQDINPDDVESVSVLKGPAASALYGQRGQYGVIMITTKKGSKGAKKAKVEYSGALSYERAGNFMPNQNVYGGGSSQTFRTLANGQKYIDGTDESWGPKMDGTPVRMYYSFYPLDPQYGQLTPFVPQPDNIKDYYETGRTINNNISVSGGGDNATFRLSYNNANITGIEPNTWLRRNNLGVNTGLDITRKLSVTSSINYANNKGQRPSQGYYNGSTYFNQWFQRNLDLKRMENYRYPDGSILHWNLNNPTSAGVINPKPVDWNNPYFDAYENFSNDGRDRFFGNVGLSFQVLPSLKLSGFVRGDMFTQDIESRQAAGGRFVDGYAVSKYESKDMNYEFLAQYNKSWKDLSFNANLGGNILKQRYSYLTEATVGGLSSPGYYNIAASIDRPSVSSYLRRKEVRSVYGNVSFGFKNTYYVDASLRNDNSSALPADNNSYFYPGVSASMVFSELLRWKPMSYGKIRLSYAKAGADLAAMQIADVYGVGSIYTPPGSASINSLFVADQIVDKNIHPSFANSYEAGADLKFLNNR
ncbi:MAG TPA: SusC/RagA family TonB-linked outer membrane protein, partial [Flavisolibacter sp.]|nr:SusC/RagA family TonB-linked outer membrane protein [Flavisolibacter sp.]